MRDAGDRPMTARVTTLKGGDAGRYYVEDLPSYYLDSGEPPGRWHGKAAEALGLSRAAAYRHWAYARAWLRSALGGGAAPADES